MDNEECLRRFPPQKVATLLSAATGADAGARQQALASMAELDVVPGYLSILLEILMVLVVLHASSPAHCCFA